MNDEGGISTLGPNAINKLRPVAVGDMILISQEFGVKN